MGTDAEMGYFPMFFNVKGRKVLLIGAGNIALRRIETLLSFEADVTVVSPECKTEILQYQNMGRIHLLKQSYASDLIASDYFMLIAATNSEQLNRKICEDGKKAGILVNNASDKKQCDFYFPAIVRQGDIVAGVCAGGKNHKLVRKTAAAMRKWLETFMEQNMPNSADPSD